MLGAGHWPRRNSLRSGVRRQGEDIAVDEALAAPNDITENVGDRRREAGSAGDEGVELATLATRIHTGWQVSQQRPVEAPADEFGGKLRRVDADEPGLHVQIATSLGDLRRGFFPERKKGRQACVLEKPLTISAHVGEEKITERDRGETWMSLTRVVNCGVKRGDRSP
jgi:hypothetical protein